MTDSAQSGPLRPYGAAQFARKRKKCDLGGIMMCAVIAQGDSLHSRVQAHVHLMGIFIIVAGFNAGRFDGDYFVIPQIRKMAVKLLSKEVEVGIGGKRIAH